MSSQDSGDPYRSPHATVPAHDAARTPGIVEMTAILTGAAVTGGFTFLATCLGSTLSLGALLGPVFPRGVPGFGVIAGLAIFALSVSVSGYIAWRTGRAIHGFFIDRDVTHDVND